MAEKMFCDWCADVFDSWNIVDVPIRVATNPAAHTLQLDVKIVQGQGQYCKSCIREGIAGLDMGPVKRTIPSFTPRTPRI